MMSPVLNSLNGGLYRGPIMGSIKGDTRTLDYSSDEGFFLVSLKQGLSFVWGYAACLSRFLIAHAGILILDVAWH